MIDSMSAELVWFLLGLFLMLAELATPGFVIIFFGVGAWVTALSAAIGLTPGFNGQLILFLISSIVLLALFRKTAMKYFEGRISKKMAPREFLEELKGSKAVALTNIVPKQFDGKVEMNGTSWQAVSDVPIAKGTTVEVVDRTDLILKVQPIP
jgi:inner membrane protein